MSTEKVLADVPGITLTRTHFQYDFRNGFLDMLITGKVGIKGLAPVQHVNAVEVTRKRASIFLSIFVFLLFLVGLSCPVAAIAGPPDEAGIVIVLFVFFAAFALTALFWLIYKQTLIVIYSGGTDLVEHQVGGSGNRERTEQMVRVYTKIKVAELVSKSQTKALPQTGTLTPRDTGSFQKIKAGETAE